MWVFICDPRPSPNRPPDSNWRSFAATATVIGLRANATASPVLTLTRLVRAAATASPTNGSCLVSAIHSESMPSSSTSAATAASSVGEMATVW